jgi:hypothetical protein
MEGGDDRKIDRKIHWKAEAVCELPNPNNNHELVMTKFACLCMKTFDANVHEMVKQCSPDTTD